jgi:hypothetical protein
LRFTGAFAYMTVFPRTGDKRIDSIRTGHAVAEESCATAPVVAANNKMAAAQNGIFTSPSAQRHSKRKDPTLFTVIFAFAPVRVRGSLCERASGIMSLCSRAVAATRTAAC